ncbi:MAG TPA: hypothetical protein VI233_15900, partial [Puia sp.]
MIRLNAPIGLVNGKSGAAYSSYGKLGGGSRVRKLQISDNWKDMTQGADDKTVAYGIKYEYITQDDEGKPISSGVAAYEPGIGNEENPFHEPVNFTEKVQWGQDKYHFIEKPFGESYFPGPDVGYSEVKATNYGTDANANVTLENNGYTISRFYTARDFPTQVDNLPLEQRTAENDLTLLLFAAQYTMRVATSQGFKVTLNDMHGKPKFTGVYDNGGNLLSSTENYYSVKDDNASQKQLNNTVLSMDASGAISAAGNLIGTDEELVTDIRESISKSSGTSIGAYPGGTWFFFFFPFAAVNYNHTGSERTYNSVSTVKVIHQYGILKQTKTTQNGSTLTADNLLWDGMTGQVLVTRTQNEYDDYTYAINYPAYMAYEGMSGAYQNIGGLFTDLFDPAGGGLIKSTLNDYFSPGDMLVNLDVPDTWGWIIPRPGGASGFHLIDKDGNFLTTAGRYRLVRSGRRNLLSASVGTVVTMNNPLMQSGNVYVLQAGVDKRVLGTKAVTFKDEWDIPVRKIPVPGTITDYCLPRDIVGGQQYLTNFMKVFFLYNVKPFVPSRRNIFATQSDNVTLADLVNQGVSKSLFDASMMTNLFGAVCNSSCTMPDLSQVKYYLINPHPVSGTDLYQMLPGDEAYIGTETQQYGRIVFSGDGITGDGTMNQFLQNPAPSADPPPVEDPPPGTIPYLCPVGAPSCPGGTQNPSVTANFSRDPGQCQPAAFAPLKASRKNKTGAASASRLRVSYHDLTMTWIAMPITRPDPNVTVCTDPVNQIINPYYMGVKGNWRADYEHVYQVNRMQTGAAAGQNGATDIRHSGYYSSYTPFWTQSGHRLQPLPEVTGPVKHTLSDSRWEWTSKTVHFDEQGNAVESVDPLNIYGAALYGYQRALATAVAKNARHNEIAFDGFEDYYFYQTRPVTGATDPCPTSRHLDFGLTQNALKGQNVCAGNNCLVSDPDLVHSGNYSLYLQSSIAVTTKPAGNAAPPDGVLDFDPVQHYKLLSNEQAAGFAPINAKDYLFSVWVKDASPASDKIVGLHVTLNGQGYDTYLNTYKAKVVEGWKKLDLKFTASASFSMTLQGEGIYIDDLRILPYNAEMKTFVYDDMTSRLTAQLDENNYGIFYEYDEEGTPVRVKKETERGIMTINENRKSYRKYIQPN